MCIAAVKLTDWTTYDYEKSHWTCYFGTCVVVIYTVSEIIHVAVLLVFSTNSETLRLSKTIPISMYVYHCVLGVVDGCTCTYKDLYTRTFFSTCNRLTNDSHESLP